MSSSRSIFESFQSKKGLPVSRPTGSDPDHGIRRRLSSLSLQIQEQGLVERSRSMSSRGADSIRQWWGWGWEWILSKKPTFAQDLEMNEQEMAALGSHSKGTFRHVFFKLAKLLRGSSHNMVLPQSVRRPSNF